MEQPDLFGITTPPSYKEKRRTKLLAHRSLRCELDPFRENTDGDMVRFDDGRHLLLEADSLEVMAKLPDKCADLVITDPPYAANTHTNALSNRNGQRNYGVASVEFDSFTDDDLRTALNHLGRLTRRWVIATVDYRHAFRLEDNPPEGLTVLRIGVWVKSNPMPQISGDRPGMGWESIVFMHRKDIGPTWTGGGRSSVWKSPVARGVHPTTKPLAMVQDWVQLFSEPDDLVFDPFVGSGTTAVAAKAAGRRSVSIEKDPQWLPHARDQLAQGVFE